VNILSSGQHNSHATTKSSLKQKQKKDGIRWHTKIGKILTISIRKLTDLRAKSLRYFQPTSWLTPNTRILQTTDIMILTKFQVETTEVISML